MRVIQQVVMCTRLILAGAGITQKFSSRLVSRLRLGQMGVKMAEVTIVTTTVHKVDNLVAAYMMAAYINKEQVIYENQGELSIDDCAPETTYKATVTKT